MPNPGPPEPAVCGVAPSVAPVEMVPVGWMTPSIAVVVAVCVGLSVEGGVGVAGAATVDGDCGGVTAGDGVSPAVVVCVGVVT